MYTRRMLALGLLAASLLRAQDAEPKVQVTGAVKRALTLSAGDLAKMPRASVRVAGGAKEMVYEGVWLHEILKKAGVPLGGDLRGMALTSYVLAEAQDGYQVVFSLAELDPTFIDNEVLLADSVNGQPLSGPQGRFRLLAPKEKHGSRSVHLLTKLEVVQVRK